MIDRNSIHTITELLKALPGIRLVRTFNFLWFESPDPERKYKGEWVVAYRNKYAHRDTEIYRGPDEEMAARIFVTLVEGDRSPTN